MPGIVVLGAGLRWDLEYHPLQVTRGRFNLDHVSAKVGQDHRRARTGDETREVHYLQSRENVVIWRCVLSFHESLLSANTSPPLELCGALLEEGLGALLFVFCPGAQPE